MDTAKPPQTIYMQSVLFSPLSLFSHTWSCAHHLDPSFSHLWLLPWTHPNESCAIPKHSSLVSHHVSHTPEHSDPPALKALWSWGSPGRVTGCPFLPVLNWGSHLQPCLCAPLVGWWLLRWAWGQLSRVLFVVPPSHHLPVFLCGCANEVLAHNLLNDQYR